MSSNNNSDELWFCHECHAEMRPLMVPTAHCSSCNSDFVERIENAGGEDDPREFTHPGAGPDMDAIGGLLQMLMNAPGGPAFERRPSGVRFEMRTSSGDGRERTFVFGGPNTLGTDGHPPPLDDFFNGAFMHGERLNTEGRRAPGGAFPAAHPLAGHPLFALFPGFGMPRGQMGDYAFDQEAFDAIVTQLMEASNANRPVAAPEEMITGLPRRKVSVETYLTAENDDVRGRECAVCKDTLLPSPDSADAEGLVTLVTLPCAHEFHEDCIVPWLKNSGTCPVCRHQLIAQPSHDHGPPQHAPRNEGEHDQQQRGGITSRIPGVNSLTTAASNLYHQFRHSGSAPTNDHNAEYPRRDNSPSSSTPPGRGTFGRSAIPPQFPDDHYTGPEYTSSSRRPLPRRSNSGGYVLGSSSPPRAGSPEHTRHMYSFVPREGRYDPWAGSPASGSSSSSNSPTSRRPRNSQRDGTRSPRDERRPGAGSSRNDRDRSGRTGGSHSPTNTFPGGWTQPDLD